MSQEIENNFEERKKDWDLTGLLGDVIRRYIYQLTNDELNEMILSILVDTFISKISFPMQPGPEIGSISDA